MNLVLADAEEFRRVKRKPAKTAAAPGASAPQAMVETEEKRSLGLAIVRGAHIVSCSVDGPPPADPAARLGNNAPGGVGGAPAAMAAGPGIARPAGRGMPVGLQGPAAGMCTSITYSSGRASADDHDRCWRTWFPRSSRRLSRGTARFPRPRRTTW